jgi:colicin import membrane protein
MPESAASTSAGTTVDQGPRLSPSEVVPPPRRPNLTGDLDDVLEFLPVFRVAVRGYDRTQVDSYVSWAERELRAVRRSADEMAARFAASWAELDRAREELSRSAAGRDARQVSERVARMLELAAEEAAEITAAGAAEAEEVVATGRSYSAAMLRHAREAEDAAAGERRRAATTCAEAAEVLAAARAEADEMRAAAVREQARLTAEATDARERLDRESASRRSEAEERARRQREQEAAAAAEVVAAARREIEELHRQRDRASASLRQLTARIGEALQTLAAGLPLELPHAVGPPNAVELPNAVGLPNVVAPQPQERTPAG